MVNMKKVNIYSTGIQLSIRIISLLATIILVISNTRKVIIFGLENLVNYRTDFYGFIINCISIILFFR